VLYKNCLIRNAYKILVRKSEGNKPLGRSRRIWENNNRMDLGEMVWEFSDWMHLTRHRDQWRALVNTAINLKVP